MGLGYKLGTPFRLSQIAGWRVAGTFAEPPREYLRDEPIAWINAVAKDIDATGMDC